VLQLQAGITSYVDKKNTHKYRQFRLFINVFKIFLAIHRVLLFFFSNTDHYTVCMRTKLLHSKVHCKHSGPDTELWNYEELKSKLNRDVTDFSRTTHTVFPLVVRTWAFWPSIRNTSPSTQDKSLSSTHTWEPMTMFKVEACKLWQATNLACEIAFQVDHQISIQCISNYCTSMDCKR
jgi:hypothetical protein